MDGLVKIDPDRVIGTYGDGRPITNRDLAEEYDALRRNDESRTDSDETEAEVPSGAEQ